MAGPGGATDADVVADAVVADSGLGDGVGVGDGGLAGRAGGDEGAGVGVVDPCGATF